MTSSNTITRRHMLEMAGAAGGLAIAGGVRGAWAQAGKRIEQLAPELDKIISTSEPIPELATGLGGELGPAEGPLWWKEGRYLLFSDIHANKRMKYTPGQGVTLFKEPTNRANGLTRDLQGRLVACEHDTRRVTRQELDGSITVIANSFHIRGSALTDRTTSWSSPTTASTSLTPMVPYFLSSGTCPFRASTASRPIWAPRPS